MKKSVLAILAAALLLSFCACKTESRPEVDYDIDLNDKIEISALMPSASMSPQAFDNQDDYVIKTIREQTGYVTHYTQLPATDAEGSLARHIANRDPYHVMKVNKAQLDENIASGALCDITAAIEKWGPNLKAKIPEAAWESVTRDGKIYAIPEVSPANFMEFGLVFNMNHLNYIGLELPETLEEFRTTLEQLALIYGDGNKMYRPFSFPGTATLVKQITSAYGLMGDPDHEWYEDDGEVKYFYQHEAMQQYLSYMGGLSEEGLIDTSFITTDGNGVKTKFVNQRISVGYMPYWDIDPLREQLKGKVDENGDPIEIGFVNFLKKDASSPEYMSGTMGIGYYTAIPWYMAKTAGYVIDWCDKKIADECATKMCIGEEGVHWEYDENGDRRIKDKEKFKEVLNASNYLTGNNKDVAKEFWALRQDLYDCWEIIIPDDKVLPSTLLPFTPTFDSYATKYQKLMPILLQDIQRMIAGNTSKADYLPSLEKWKANGGADALAEANDWYRTRNA